MAIDALWAIADDEAGAVRRHAGFGDDKPLPPDALVRTSDLAKRNNEGCTLVTSEPARRGKRALLILGLVAWLGTLEPPMSM